MTLKIQIDGLRAKYNKLRIYKSKKRFFIDSRMQILLAGLLVFDYIRQKREEGRLRRIINYFLNNNCSDLGRKWRSKIKGLSSERGDLKRGMHCLSFSAIFLRDTVHSKAKDIIGLLFYQAGHRRAILDYILGCPDIDDIY